VAVTLTADSYRLLYVPKQFAQGFLTLEDDTEVTYQVSEFYSPRHEAGARYDDPAFGIHWPAPVSVISDKDKNWPAFQPDAFLNLSHQETG
jgi:dTDP-4-dehydrorhamnose 3,5-epimerase